MNKMEYQKPWAEFVQFSNEDIITESMGQQPDGSCPNNGTHWHCFLIFGDWCNQQKCETRLWRYLSDSTTPYSLDEDQYSDGGGYSDGVETFEDDTDEWSE